MATTNTSKLFSVEGMVVVITGGGTGIGYMMTKGLIDHGASKIYIIGRRLEKLQQAAQYSPQKIIPLVGDVTSKTSLLSLASQIQASSAHINLLICNSGIAPHPVAANPQEVSVADFATAALNQDPDKDWGLAFATNSTAIFFTTMAFLTLLDAGNKAGNAPGRTSQVLVTSSIAAFHRPNTLLGPYQASKAAATHLVKHLSSVLAPYSIRVNALAPGLFPSDLAQHLIDKAAGEGVDPLGDDAFPATQIPGRRLGREEDMVGTVVYLAARSGGYVNGNVLVVDGGRLGQAPSSY